MHADSCRGPVPNAETLMSHSLSRHLPQPDRLRGVLPALCAVAGFGLAVTCTAEPSAGAHTQAIEVAAGDFVHAVVEQRSDVRVELLAPDGREVLHVDGPNRILDEEEIAAVAETAGRYEIAVHGCPEGAPAAGCYTLHLDPPRPATEADRQRAEAVRTTQEAVDAMGKPDTLSVQRARRERALALWSGLGERRRVAEELYQLGMVQQRLQQVEPAVRLLHQALAIYVELGDLANQAKALNETGKTYEETDPWKAVESYRQALVKALEAGDRKQQTSIHNNLGLRLNYIGERREALDHLQRALALARQLGSGEANVLNNLGLVYSALGETQEAIRQYRQALAIPGAPSSDRAAALNNLGTAHADLGNWDEAAESFDQAIAINRKQGDLYRLASTLNNLGLAQHYSGQIEAARTSYQEALDLARETRNFTVQVQAANNYGFLLERSLGATEEALAQWREVVRLAAEDPLLDYVGLAARGSVERGENRLAEARETLRKAIDRSTDKGELRIAADMTWRLARVERELGDLTAAETNAAKAIQMVESQRNRVVSIDQRALFLASAQSFYELHIRILMELDRQHPGKGYDTRALTVSEQARARSFLDLLGEAEPGLRRGVPRKLLEDEQAKRARLRELDRRQMELIHQGASPEEVEQADERLHEAIAELEDVEAALRESSVSYAALTPQTLNVREIQTQVLGEQTLLLEYAIGEERSYLWAVTPEAVQSFELPPRKEIVAAALDFYNATTARNTGALALRHPERFDARAESAGRALSRMILGPVEHLLGGRLLLVVSDGALQYVPFAALPLPSSPKERILVRNEVVSLPSASALAALRRQIEGRPAAPKTLAVLADPVFAGDPRLLRLPRFKSSQIPLAAHRPVPPPRSPDSPEDQLLLPPLPFAGEEAKNILAFVPDAGQKLAAIGFAASYELATSGELAEYRHVHFATHGLLDSQQPKLSKLALSQFRADGRRQEESFLRLADIYNLDLNADLVALSACKTALGKELRGEGLVGLTRGFMYAGAARVLASLWSVEDRATARLMKSFYRYLLAEKRPAADALRRAQLDLAGKPPYDAPYYWAGFSLQGEWK
jgi:CHAT domain-containing protein/Tfp pilus assembly protein PilF